MLQREIQQNNVRFSQGADIARILSHPSHGNLPVALLARNNDGPVQSTIIKTSPQSVIEIFPIDTNSQSLSSAFSAIRACETFRDLKLKVAAYSIKHLSKEPFLEETYEDFTSSLQIYVDELLPGGDQDAFRA